MPWPSIFLKSLYHTVICSSLGDYCVVSKFLFAMENKEANYM